MIDAETVQRALEKVIDPCSVGVGRPRSIVQLGIVERISIANNKVHIDLILTDPICPYARSLVDSTRASLRAVENIEEVEVEISKTVWSPERDPAHGRWTGLSKKQRESIKRRLNESDE